MVGGCIPAPQFAEWVSCVGVGLNITTWADDDSKPILAAARCHVRRGGGHYVCLEDIGDLVRHSSASVTETAYRHEIRPALTDNATAVNRILKANAIELACPCSGKVIGSLIGSRKLNPKTCLTSRDGEI